MADYTTIDDPSAYFKCHLYTGTGSSNAQTFADTDTDMQPDFVWIKSRENTETHVLYDAVRGVQKRLISSSSAAESDHTHGLTAFGSDGFTVGSGSDGNQSGIAFVAWCWKESATAGFDIVNYSGTGSNNTFSHSLSAVPHFFLPKNRDTAEGWHCYHHKQASDPETDHLTLNGTAGISDDATMWNDTAPTSSVISVGTADGPNKSGDDIIYYIWTSIQGFSKFGGYTGNGNADGPFIYTGFRPAWIMVKRTDTTNYWTILDNKRDTYNPVEHMLWPNVTDAEDDGTDRFDFCSNGFKCVNDGSAFNTSGGTYIYAAFAEAPFVNSEGVPCNAR